MKKKSHICWGRVITAAVFSEIGVIVILLSVMAAYRYLIAPGLTTSDYASFNELASYYVAPAASGVMTFFCALWVGRKLTSGFIANGILVGVAAVVLTVGFVFVAKAEDRLMYGVSFVLRILGAYGGGLVAQRLANRRGMAAPMWPETSKETT